mgnify:CR=1 FL=1
MAEYDVIADAAGLDEASALLAAGTGPVAVDVERASGFRYSQRAYLVQVFRRGAGAFLFDPPAIGDMLRPSAPAIAAALRPARSLASHCTTKRMVNMPWATKPSSTQPLNWAPKTS